MTQNIVCILGSPRIKGNSTALAIEVNKTAKALGATIQTFLLNTMSTKGCQGCERCKMSDTARCPIDDDLKPVLAAIENADSVIFASPVYFGDVSSQLKTLIDRTYSYMKPHFWNHPNPSKLIRPKTMLWILTQGDHKDVHGDIFKRYKAFYTEYGFKTIEELRVGDVNALGAIKQNSAALEAAQRIAKQLFQ